MNTTNSRTVLAPNHQEISIPGDGVGLAADLWTPLGGERRGSAILLHGGGQTRHSWGETADRLLQEGWQVLSFDARGHGDSEWATDTDYGIDHFVADLAEAGRRVDDVPVLVGASLGGITSLLAVGEGQVRARAIVLVDVTPEVNRAGVARIHDFMLAHKEGFASLGDVAAAIEEYNPRGRGRSEDGLRKNVRQAADGRWYWHWDPEFITPSMRGRELVPPARMRSAAAAVTIPTLLVHGQRSDIVTQHQVDEFRALMGHAEIQQADAGHMVAGDSNAVFADGLLDFLAALP
jgi:pimeloyl-ACP methyl ester carboxylesterase